MRRERRDRGFTLIELMIVISIIAVLASLIVVGVNKARKRGQYMEARSTIDAIATALRTYDADKGILPGHEDPAERHVNSLPKILAALLGDGVREPYLDYKEGQLKVEREGGGFRAATRAEIFDASVDKYILDPWGEPYIARENRSRRKKEPWMHRPHFVDIYSKGPNREDDTALGKEGADSDDISNWK